MNWETIVGLIVVISLVIAIIVKSIIDKKKGKSSCSCGGNCSACNVCHPDASKELKDAEQCDCENNSKN
ncbi:MAG: FeoB-associated Cys-rich membrane protein [Clostridia bacterium]|nr:FeoB-associated Cys-rich membrane protein [Clostridia bacterium]